MTPPAHVADRYASIWKRSGYHGPEAAQIAAHSTRDRKEIHSPAEVLAAHRQIAAEFGNQADKVVADARAREHGLERDHESSQQVARQAVTYARDRSFEREAVTDERDIYRDALRRGMAKRHTRRSAQGSRLALPRESFSLWRDRSARLRPELHDRRDHPHGERSPPPDAARAGSR